MGIDPIGASTDSTALLYKVIRDDIVSGRLTANQRLVVTDLAKRHGSSTTPVREVLQLLRGEGFVVFTRNRGARVRPIDRDFIRDIYEIGVLIEPSLTRWFVGMATEADIAELEVGPKPDRGQQFRRPDPTQRPRHEIPHLDLPATLQSARCRAVVETS